MAQVWGKRNGGRGSTGQGPAVDLCGFDMTVWAVRVSAWPIVNSGLCFVSIPKCAMVRVGDGRHGGEVDVIHHGMPGCSAGLVCGFDLQRGSVLSAKDCA